jgi:hypothetical protein
MIITASTKELKQIPAKYKIFSICLYPRFLKTENIKALAPTKEMFSKGYYPDQYYEHVKDFDFLSMFAKYKDICFVCFCLPPGTDCHRRSLSEYIEKKFKIKVQELSLMKKKDLFDI